METRVEGSLRFIIDNPVPCHGEGRIVLIGLKSIMLRLAQGPHLNHTRQIVKSVKNSRSSRSRRIGTAIGVTRHRLRRCGRRSPRERVCIVHPPSLALQLAFNPHKMICDIYSLVSRLPSSTGIGILKTASLHMQQILQTLCFTPKRQAVARLITIVSA